MPGNNSDFHTLTFAIDENKGAGPWILEIVDGTPVIRPVPLTFEAYDKLMEPYRRRLVERQNRPSVLRNTRTENRQPKPFVPMSRDRGRWRR